MSCHTKNLVVMVLTGALFLGASGGAGMAGDCAISAVEARKLIAQFGLMSAGEARRIAAARASGRAFHVRLCRSGGSFYYAVKVMQGGGGKKLMTVNVNARR